MKKQIIPGPEARVQILEGAKLLYDAVSTTLGPKGNNAVIEAYGEPIVTHDGVTVAKAVEVSSEDRPGVRVGVELIKSSSSRTNDNVGDGTTSSTILAYHLIEGGLKLIDKGTNPMMLRRDLDSISKVVIQHLDQLKEEVSTKESIIDVATISCESEDIGTKIGTLYHDLGPDPAVSVEVGQKDGVFTFIDEGYSMDRGVLSPSMISDHRTQTTTCEKPAVLIFDGKIADLAQLPLDLWNDGKDSLVVICSAITDDVVETSLDIQNKFKVIAIKSPGFGEEGRELLKDLAALTGTEVYKKFEDVDHRKLGTCDRIVASTKETIITGSTDVKKYIDDLKARREDAKTELAKQKLDKRISKLHAKVGRIEVGGATDMEAEERKYLVDDAVAATEAAIKEGIVPGGGTTYIQLADKITEVYSSPASQVFAQALEAPFKVLMSNAGERAGVLREKLKPGKGYDVITGDLVDLKEHGIIDPVLVIKQAITNAVSVAGSALTTGVLIVNEKEKNDEKEE